LLIDLLSVRYAMSERNEATPAITRIASNLRRFCPRFSRNKGERRFFSIADCE
jgi:hypothetical protein